MNIPFWSDSTSISHEHIHFPADFSNQDLLVGAAFFQRRLEEGCVKGRKMGHITVTGFTPASALEAGGRFFSAVHRWELP